MSDRRARELPDYSTIWVAIPSSSTINPFRYLVFLSWCRAEIGPVNLNHTRQFFSLMNLRSHRLAQLVSENKSRLVAHTQVTP
jgi:hypothetical protein